VAIVEVVSGVAVVEVAAVVEAAIGAEAGTVIEVAAVVEAAVVVKVEAVAVLVVRVGLAFAERSAMVLRIACTLLLYICCELCAKSIHKAESVQLGFLHYPYLYLVVRGRFENLPMLSKLRHQP